MSHVAPEALLYCALLGVGLGILFAVLEMVRLLLALGKLSTVLLDLLFCILAAGTSFILALAVSAGQIRFFQVGCELLGFFCVQITLTHAVRRLVPWFVRMLRKLWGRMGIPAVAVGKKTMQKKGSKKEEAGRKCRLFQILSKKNEKKT